jgi:hypothetical protein
MFIYKYVFISLRDNLSSCLFLSLSFLYTSVFSQLFAPILDATEMDSRAETLAGEKEAGRVEDKETGRTRSPSPVPSIDKEKNDFGDQPTDIEGSIPEEKTFNDASADDEGDYPSGFRLAAIVLALLLSIFLVCDLCFLVSEIYCRLVVSCQ